MASVSDFLNDLDWRSALFYLGIAAASLLCITVHELCHGLAAYRLGDPTAKNAGRLTLNPFSHLDFLGFVMMLTVHMGWAKPVPIDMRNFRHPKRDMAITALAGPASNFCMAALALLLGRLVLSAAPQTAAWSYVLLFLVYIAGLSVGLGVFNFIPIPPLDGSKIVLSLLPDRVCYQVLRYERFGMVAMLALVWLGVFDAPLSFLMSHASQFLCTVTGFPYAIMQAIFY